MIKDGAKMSKSRGNVVNPDEYIEKYGADTLRLYLVFMGPMDGYPDFRDEGIEGMGRFVERVWKLCVNTKLGGKAQDLVRNQTVKKVTGDIEVFKYNTALAQIMIFVNSLCEQAEKEKKVAKEDIEALTLLLAPFAPHLTEEIWREVLGKGSSIHTASWPKWDEEATKEENVTIVVQVNGKVRGQISVPSEQSRDQNKVEKLARGDTLVSKWLSSEPKKTIFIPGKLLNFVV
jgi:leucyl-tRNA synthetase